MAKGKCDSMLLTLKKLIKCLCMHVDCSCHTRLAVPSRAHARDIGSAFQNREDLRPPICAALIRMCTQSRRMLQVLVLLLSFLQTDIILPVVMQHVR